MFKALVHPRWPWAKEEIVIVGVEEGSKWNQVRDCYFPTERGLGRWNHILKEKNSVLVDGKADAHTLYSDQEEDPGMQMPQRDPGKICVKRLLDYGYFLYFQC